MACSVCVFDNAISSRSSFIDHTPRFGFLMPCPRGALKRAGDAQASFVDYHLTLLLNRTKLLVVTGYCGGDPAPPITGVSNVCTTVRLSNLSLVPRRKGSRERYSRRPFDHQRYASDKITASKALIVAPRSCRCCSLRGFAHLPSEKRCAAQPPALPRPRSILYLCARVIDSTVAGEWDGGLVRGVG
jgi:hypothetical protein